MAFKIINDTVIHDNKLADIANVKVDGIDVLVGDGNSSTKVNLQNVTLDGSVDLSTNLTTDDLPEGTTNKYYTDGKVQAVISQEIITNSLADTGYVDAGDATTLVDANNYADTGDAATLQSAQSYADSVVTSGTGSLTTDDISEASNFYFTDARVQTYLDVNDYATELFAINYTNQEVATATTNLQTYADQAVANLVDSAPTTLDTLNELAGALGDDPNFATTLANNIATKVAKSGDTMTGALTLSGAPSSANHAATKAYVDSAVTSGTGSLDTDSVPEGGANLYYTDARVQTYIEGDRTHGGITVDSITGTGALAIKSGNQYVYIRGTDNGNMFAGKTGEWSAMYYADSIKVQTKSAGVDVTGQLDVAGEIVATGDVTAYSDRALKRNIQTIENGLDKVMNMRGVTYEKDGKTGLGVIAQEVEEVLPEVVKQDQHGMRSVAYGNIVGVLVEAIKEQQKQIDELKSKLDD